LTDAAAVHELTVRRVFDAPRPLVRKAWSEPERLAFGEVTVRPTGLADGRTEMVFQATLEAPDDVRAQALGGLVSALDRLAEEVEAR
jgi:hypothetical protein